MPLLDCGWFSRLLTSSSAGAQEHDYTHSEVHDYIQHLLETGEHGSNRVLVCGAKTLNDALEKYADRLAEKLKPEFEKPVTIQSKSDEAKVTVHNYLGNVEFQCYVHAPKSLLEIVDLFRQAKEEKLKIRAVGAFHSWSPICATDGYLIQTTYLTGTSPADQTFLKDPGLATSHFDVLSGTTLKDVATELEKHGRAMMNMGGYSGLHIVGISCTGAHGSGVTLPPLANMIRSVTLVSAKFGSNGVPIVYRIEPSNGITDPTKPIPNVTLIQDDATFNAVIVGLGAFGVVYSVTIETVPFYWIKETRDSVDWATAKSRLQQGLDGEILKYHNAEIWLNPYTSKALITQRELVTSEPPDVTNPNTNAFITFLHSIPAFEKIWKAIVGPNGPDDIYRELGKLLGLLLKHLPLLVPAVINITLDTQNHPKAVFAKYYDIYDVGFANRFPVICCEVSYPMETYIDGVSAAIDAVHDSREKDIHKAIVGFMSVRFTSSTPATLSMGYHPGPPSASNGRSYLEIFSLSYFYESLQIYDDIVRPIQQHSIGSYLARHHWGQYMTPGFKAEEYKKKDPGFAKNIAAVREIADKYDPEHIMTNTFLEKVVFTT